MAEGKKVDIRNISKSSSPGTPRPTTVDIPGLKGTLPFTPARTINASGDVPTIAREEEKRLASEPIVTPDVELKRAIIPKTPVQLDELPADKQEEVLANVRAAMDRAPVQTFVPRGPGIAEAKAMADRATARIEEQIFKNKPAVPTQESSQSQGLQYESTQSQAVQQQAESQADSGSRRIYARMRHVAPPEDEVQEEKKEEPKQDDAGGSAALPSICPHCGWPVNTMDDCKPDHVDKQLFVASVLGQRRWSKEYNLLGGQMKVVFRSLTVDENDLVVKQLLHDWNDGKISGPAHSFQEATKYQLALALESIETNVGPITLPSLEDYDYDEPEKGTILPDIVIHVNKTAMPNEPIRRIIHKAYAHFIETQSKLEAMAETPDFWKATEE